MPHGQKKGRRCILIQGYFRWARNTLNQNESEQVISGAVLRISAGFDRRVVKYF